VIGLSGSLAFGDVEVGTTKDAQVTISNGGSTTLTVSGMTGPSGYTASWTSGTIAAGASQPVSVRFSPTAEQAYNGTLTVNADHTSGTNTISVSGRGVRPPGPRTQFGAGRYLVGTDIAPGRYYSDPRSGCYWERLSGLGGSLGEIIANEFIGDDPSQWIVDIAASDRAFSTDGECGTWFNTPRSGARATITSGVWLVGSQITPGIYRSTVSSGCYWERKRGFGGTLSDIIDNDFIGAAGPQRVEVRPSDVGFQSDSECGTWIRDAGQVSGQAEPPARSTSDIEANRRRHREWNGVAR
jgi:hypothetical protein